MRCPPPEEPECDPIDDRASSHPTRQVGGLRTRTRAGHLGHLAAPEISWGVGGPGTCPGPPRAPPRGGRFGRGKEELAVPGGTASSHFPRQGRRLLWRLLGPENCGGDAGGQEVSNDVRYSPLGARAGQLLAWAPIRHRQACHRTPLRPPVAVELVRHQGPSGVGRQCVERRERGLETMDLATTTLARRR